MLFAVHLLMVETNGAASTAPFFLSSGLRAFRRRESSDPRPRYPPRPLSVTGAGVNRIRPATGKCLDLPDLRVDALEVPDCPAHVGAVGPREERNPNFAPRVVADFQDAALHFDAADASCMSFRILVQRFRFRI
jgi:hypothetical protein